VLACTFVFVFVLQVPYNLQTTIHVCAWIRRSPDRITSMLALSTYPKRLASIFVRRYVELAETMR
jgi:hypothetical protein